MQGYSKPREGLKLSTWWMSSNGAPPLKFIEGVHGAFGRGMQLCLLEPTLGASQELPRVKVEAVGPMGLVGRPWWSAGLPGAPTALNFSTWAVQVSLVLNTLSVSCSKDTHSYCSKAGLA